MQYVETLNNFARGKLDHDMQGRYDLPIYKSGADVFDNFLSNFKGNMIYRPGFLEQVVYADCALVEFKFNDEQNYLLVMTANLMQFLSYDVNNNFGWVLNGGGTPLQVVTPYSLQDSKDIALDKPSQNSDVMNFTHKNWPPYRLKRTAANAFTFQEFARLWDPFGLTYAGTKTITGITNANPAVVTSAAHGYSTGDMLLILAVVGMTQINNYTARLTVINANSYSLDIDTSNTTLFTAYSSGGTSQKRLTSDNPAHNLYYDGRLYYAATPTKPTTMWGSQSSVYDTYLSNPAPGTVTATTPLQFTLADISQKILSLFPGENSLLALSADGVVPINGGAVNTSITAATISGKLVQNTKDAGCSAVYPLAKDGLVFYVGKNGRSVYSFNYDILSEKFISEDVNYLSYEMSQATFTKIRYKKDKNDLMYFLRADGTYATLNFNLKEKINGWHESFLANINLPATTMSDIAQIVDNNGTPHIYSVNQYNGAFYIEQQAELVEFIRRDRFFTDDKSADDEAYNRYIAEQMKGNIYLDNALTYSDYRISTITFDGVNTITAGSASFSSGDVGKHIVYKTMTGYESGRFEILTYVDTTHVTVSVLQTPTANVFSSWYKSFKTITGLSQYNGTTVAVCADGGYDDDFAVSGGTLTLEGQVTQVVVGYRYRGLYKSFGLGFQIRNENTQITTKTINQADMRLVNSSGGKCGTTLYDLRDIQELGQQEINYLPPIPIDGTKRVDGFTDESETDKYFYIVQDLPLAFCVAAAFLTGEYTVNGLQGGSAPHQ